MNKQRLDTVSLHGLKVFAHHGAYTEEKQLGQFFYLDLDCHLSTRRAGKSDDLKDALNYGEAAELLAAAFSRTTCDLIEAAAEHAANELLHAFPLIRRLDLTVRKPSAPVSQPMDWPSVTIHRGWHQALLALGSNIEPRMAYVTDAVRTVANHTDMRLLRTADWIETAPWGVTDQPAFINGAITVETLLDPHELLDAVHAIEASANRERKQHWGPRTLDIDIIYYDDLILETDDLIIPHPYALERDFVLIPAAQIAPYLIDPRTGHTLSSHLSSQFKKQNRTKKNQPAD